MPPRIWIPNSRASAALKNSGRRAEALALYREILRTAKAFHWCDEDGIPWNKRLREEARREFEASREERDPLIIAKMLVTGHQCVDQIQQKFNAANEAARQRIQRDSPNSRVESTTRRF